MSENDAYSKLRELRKSRGLTVHKLADKIGEDHQKVGRIERGKRSLTVDYLMKVSRALDTPLQEILNSNDEKESKNEIDGDKKKLNSELLEEIITFMEKMLSSYFNVKERGKLISKVYELVSNLPEDYQKLYTKLIMELLLDVLKTHETHI